MLPIDAQTMTEIAPRFSGAKAAAQARIISEAGAALRTTLGAYDISTRLRIAHFLGQTCHESAGFRATEEFASGEAYEGRKDLGNTQEGDGPRFKGRGLLQLTGRANYREYGKALKLDLEKNPVIAAQPAISLLIACEYWKRRKINADCDRDDIEAVTRKINGGLNGIADRRGFTSRAKTVLARIEGIQLSGAPDQAPGTLILQRGSTGEAVAELQRKLRALGFMLAVDADFGPATETAVARFQQEKGLTVDGIVGAETWGALG
jgi:putative chitinase